jgi:hypothetical protein
MMDLDLESSGPMEPKHKDEDDVRSDMEIQDQISNEDQMAQPQQLEYSLLAPNMKLSIRSNENWHEEYSYISPVTVISHSGLVSISRWSLRQTTFRIVKGSDLVGRYAEESADSKRGPPNLQPPGCLNVREDALRDRLTIRLFDRVRSQKVHRR